VVLHIVSIQALHRERERERQAEEKQVNDTAAK
jgi:hypothetical protein